MIFRISLTFDYNLSVVVVMRYYYSSAGVLLRQRKYIVLAMRIYFSGNLNLLLLQCQFITV